VAAGTEKRARLLGRQDADVWLAESCHDDFFAFSGGVKQRRISPQSAKRDRLHI
jgi:hypothetical protein